MVKIMRSKLKILRKLLLKWLVYNLQLKVWIMRYELVILVICKYPFLFHAGNKPAYSILQWVDDDTILIYS